MGNSAHDGQSKAVEKGPQHRVEEGLIKSRNKAGLQEAEPSAPAGWPPVTRMLGAPPGLLALLPCALPLPPVSPPPAGLPCRPGLSAIVITHANACAPETKRGQASGWGFLSTNNIRCKMCTFDKSINIALLIFFFLMKSEK